MIACRWMSLNLGLHRRFLPTSSSVFHALRQPEGGNSYNRRGECTLLVFARSQLRISLNLGWLAKLNLPGLSAFRVQAMFLGTSLLLFPGARHKFFVSRAM